MSFPVRSRSMVISKTKKEGPLHKWTNYMGGWKERYFVLDQGVLSYCKARGEKLKGMIHIGVAKIIEHKKSRRKIVIDSGMTFLHLKARTPNEREDWLYALNASKAECEMTPQRVLLPKDDASEHCVELRPLSEKLTELWELDANLEEAIDSLPDNLKERHEAFRKLTNAAKNIKTSITEVMSFLEEQQMQLARLKDRGDSGSEEGTAEEKKEESLIDLGDSSKPEDEEDEIFFDARDEDSMHAQPPAPPLEPSRSSMPYRSALPVPRNPNQKFNIWKVIKDSIGQDLSKMSVPVYFNEPISFVQRLTEDLTFHKLLIQADEAEDPCLRAAFVGCFAVSGYASTVNRTMKPFNPVLGETFELEFEGSRAISEQVSHHPPVSAIAADHPNYSFSGSTQMKSSFKGTYLQLHPDGMLHVTLKRWNEHYTYIKPLTSVHNLIIGKVYVDHHGRIEVNCEQTGVRAVMNLKKKGWFEKKLHYVEGSVLDSAGTLRYILEGTWSEGMTVREVDTGRELGGWQALPDYEGKDENYFYSQFTLQLNIPPERYPTVIPRSDSRWRPDQRALENGDTKLAKSEKERVEEKQRAARKARESSDTEYHPRWFSLVGGEWHYNGGYWEMRDRGEHVDIPDIF